MLFRSLPEDGKKDKRAETFSRGRFSQEIKERGTSYSFQLTTLLLQGQRQADPFLAHRRLPARLWNLLTLLWRPGDRKETACM
ncbi:hypothetical protein E2C01_053431 [Portunus trituberculatus]|uniref:Uncharacterized protein n=1 Tax=Portunus trituberculatus TaxID=210409 RepID=A0A5B7GKB1_PORTR|nr:hypothetical protein [Portunus trituberculatus]